MVQVGTAPVAEEQAAVETVSAPVKKAAAKKAVAKKVPAKKVAAKAAPKTDAKKPAAVKDGLRKPQLRLLETLKKVKRPTERKLLAERAEVDNAMCTEYLGSIDAEVRAKNDEKFKSLVSWKYVKVEKIDDGGKDKVVYSITDAGLKFLEKLHAKPAA